MNGTRGALDPQLFTDPAGVTWLLVALGNTESPLHTIRLYTQRRHERRARCRC